MYLRLHHPMSSHMVRFKGDLVANYGRMSDHIEAPSMAQIQLVINWTAGF